MNKLLAGVAGALISLAALAQAESVRAIVPDVPVSGCLCFVDGDFTLIAPRRPDQASAVGAELLREIYSILRANFDWVVVDTPPGFTAEVITSIDNSTEIVMVGMLDSLSLKNTKLGLETLELMKYDPERIFLLLNRAHSRVGISQSDVEAVLGRTRAGLMLALADLGNHPQGFLGAFYPVASNVIVMNKVPLLRIQETNPRLYKPYAFYVLLHEYLHSIGFVDERVCREQAHRVLETLFGVDHLVTQISADTARFFPNLVFPDAAWQPSQLALEFVPGFDRGSATYIK